MVTLTTEKLVFKPAGYVMLCFYYSHPETVIYIHKVKLPMSDFSSLL